MQWFFLSENGKLYIAPQCREEIASMASANENKNLKIIAFPGGAYWDTKNSKYQNFLFSSNTLKSALKRNPFSKSEIPDNTFSYFCLGNNGNPLVASSWYDNYTVPYEIVGSCSHVEGLMMDVYPEEGIFRKPFFHYYLLLARDLMDGFSLSNQRFYNKHPRRELFSESFEAYHYLKKNESKVNGTIENLCIISAANSVARRVSNRSFLFRNFYTSYTTKFYPEYKLKSIP